MERVAARMGLKRLLRIIEQFTRLLSFEFEGTKRSVADPGDVGGYWNDDD
jgi:hypothetical protein